MIRFYLCVLAVLGISTIAFAQDQKTEYGPKLSGVLYTRWEWNQAGAGATEKDFNQFAMERLYLNARGPLAEDLSFRATLDVYSIGASDVGLATGSTKNLNAMVQLKYAYFDWKAASWVSIRGGMQNSEWIDYVESLWKYRGIAKTLTDDRGLTSSSDLGLSAIFKLPSKLGDVQACVFNGNGFRNAEANRFKDIALRATITPLMKGGGDFKNLQVAARYYTGNTGLGVSRSRLGVLAALPHDKFSITAEYTMAQDNVTDISANTVKITGLSLMGEIKGNIVSEDLAKLAIVGRFDSYNPNTELTDAQRTTTAAATFTKLILGLSCKISNPITAVLDYQTMTYGTADLLTKWDGTKTSTDSRLYLHFIVNL